MSEAIAAAVRTTSPDWNDDHNQKTGACAPVNRRTSNFSLRMALRLLSGASPLIVVPGTFTIPCINAEERTNEKDRISVIWALDTFAAVAGSHRIRRFAAVH
jgi:hypothetical protein